MSDLCTPCMAEDWEWTRSRMFMAGESQEGPEYSLSDKVSFPFGVGVIALKWVYEVVGHDTVVVVVVVDG